MKVILPLALLTVLALAFWYGGNAPGTRGWAPVGESAVQMTAMPDTAPSDYENEMPAQTGTPDAGIAAAASPEPSGTTQPSAEPEVPEKPGTSSGITPELSEPTQPGAAPVPNATPHESPLPGMVINPETGKDKYLTDPVPEGKPLPVEPQDAKVGPATYTCTLSISCAAILNNMDLCDLEKAELVPEDGWILKPTTVTFYEGESVFNVLLRTCKQLKIHMEYEDTPIYNSAYIEGIHNLYEFDVGELSGWMYKVNEWFPNYGCSRYQLKDGDVICWVYTCDLGYDVGGGYAIDG